MASATPSKITWNQSGGICCGSGWMCPNVRQRLARSGPLVRRYAGTLARTSKLMSLGRFDSRAENAVLNDGLTRTYQVNSLGGCRHPHGLETARGVWSMILLLALHNIAALVRACSMWPARARLAAAPQRVQHYRIPQKRHRQRDRSFGRRVPR